ncbi:hypothetical protein BKA56DRAFT_562681 [Ilyonectria sp. MPI-CAGE-AT-0026]|nr:hypothetical protein BKA56DRAFT_562681 [Ilyonectria sp. MPI-CAGE-AT-0026]
MNVLVVGGTGMIGGHTALYLCSIGFKVTISGRHQPEVPLLAKLPFIRGDYTKDEITKEQLADFDVVIFAAGSDIRHIPDNEDGDEHFLRVNGTIVPAFARLARDAGVKQFIHLGSFYYHVASEKVKTSAYVRSRKMAADGVVTLATPEFSACSLDAPFVVGTVPGMQSSIFIAMTRYAQGTLGIPPYAPPGGAGFISAQSLSEAIAGAIENSGKVSGKALVFGDENLTFEAYFGMFFHALGLNTKVVASGEDHPLLPEATRYAGNVMASVETTPDVYDLLGRYRRDDIYRAIQEIVTQYK